MRQIHKPTQWRSLLLACMIVTGTAIAGTPKCFEYPPNDFRLDYEMVNPPVGSNVEMDHIEPVDASGYRLVLLEHTPPGSIPQLQLHLLKKGDNTNLGYLLMECLPRREMAGAMECHGECDGGMALLNRTRDMLVLTDGLGFEDDKGGVWRIGFRHPEGRLKASEISCPTSLRHEKFFPLDEAYIRETLKHNTLPVRYVCYRKKEVKGDTVRYVGCEIDRYSCKEERLMRFGHYASEAETYRAFVRCRVASPRPGR